MGLLPMLGVEFTMPRVVDTVCINIGVDSVSSFGWIPSSSLLSLSFSIAMRWSQVACFLIILLGVALEGALTRPVHDNDLERRSAIVARSPAKSTALKSTASKNKSPKSTTRKGNNAA